MLAKLYNTFARIFYKAAYKLILFVWFFYRPTVKGVYIAVWHDQKILLIKNSYKKQYTIPCGRIKRGENLTRAAIRELREEVNLVGHDTDLKFVGQYTFNYQYVSEIGHFFELELSELPPVRINNREVVWAGFTAPHKALSFKLNPLVKTYISAKNDPGHLEQSDI